MWQGKEHARGGITMPWSGWLDKDAEQRGVGQGCDTEFQKWKLRLWEGGILGGSFLEGAWVVSVIVGDICIFVWVIKREFMFFTDALQYGLYARIWALI